MIAKTAFSALALAFSSPALLSSAPPTMHVHYPLVKRVDCAATRGTAFRIGPQQFLSVAHVTDGVECKIEGQSFVATNDEGLDFSVIEVPAELRRSGAMRINCGGFVPGEYYIATGYARGAPWQQQIIVRATTQQSGGQTVLYGWPTFIPGMSGGPVMAADGSVVGTVNRYSPFSPHSLALALKDTSVCKTDAL